MSTYQQTPKRFYIKNTELNKQIIRGLNYNFIISEDKKKISVKVSEEDFTIIKELLEEK